MGARENVIEPVGAGELAQRIPGRGAFQFRRPISDVLVRWLVVLVPVALGVLAGLLGIEFQTHADSFRESGPSGRAAAHLNTVNEITASMGAIGVVGLMAMVLWSGLIVTNTNRVGHSLRTPWFAAISWLLAPGLGLVAHFSLDKRLESGSLIGLTVFLAVLYLPFGTLGGAADDLGGSPHLARAWFLASVIGAFLLIVGISGATSVLPVENPQNVLKVRAFACYLGALMMVASGALAFATARDLNALIGHRWARGDDPHRLFNDPKRVKISRTGRKLRRDLTPTLFLRLIVTVGLLGTGLASVGAMFVLRGRYLNMSGASAERDHVLADFRTASIVIALLSAAVHVVYVLWAIVAALNAYRRSILAPNPMAVACAFLVGPIVIFASTQTTGPFGAAVLTVGFVLTVSGFVIGQLVLGRTVAAFGGRGGIFLRWLIADVAMGLFVVFIAANSTNRIQIVAFGVAQTAMAMLGAAMAWSAMSRLDRVCRAYRHSGSMTTDTGFACSQFVPASSLAAATSVTADQPASLAFTSSQS